MDTIRTVAKTKRTARAVTTEAMEIGGIETIVGVLFSCPKEQRREVLQTWADKTLASAASAGLDTSDQNFTLLAVALGPCNGRTMYCTVDDIPLVDVPCPCGDPNHWLIKWNNVLDTAKP